MQTVLDPALLEKLSVITAEEQAILSGEGLRMDQYGASHEVDSRKFLAERQVITLRPHTRFTAFPMHTHNYVELLWQMAGHTVHTMGDGTVLTLEAGELLLFGRGASHAIDPAGAGDIAVNFIVLPEFFDVALEMIGDHHVLGRFLIDTLKQRTPDINYFYYKVADVAPVQLILESMVMGLIDPAASSRRIDQTTMGLLFLHLSRRTDVLVIPEKQTAHILVLDALREIEENYRDADFSAIAARRHVSPTYLSYVVREATGSSCKELLQKRRMEKARELLTRTALPVMDVSLAVGYENTSYFYRLYRKFYGCSPSAHRGRDFPSCRAFPSLTVFFLNRLIYFSLDAVKM